MSFSPSPEECPKQPQLPICKQTHILMTVRKGLLGGTVPLIRPANTVEKDRQALSTKALLWM